VSYPGGRPARNSLTALDIRALCTNRDLPVLDDSPKLAVEAGDPVAKVDLLGAFRRPVPAGHGRAHLRRDGGEAHFDDIAWRLVAQLSLNHLSLADASREAEPLRAVLDLYAGRGDPALARHAQSVRKVTSSRIVERLGLPGPLCFGHGVEITLSVDETFLTGSSALLLSALMSQLFTRHAGLNGFVRTRTRLTQRQEEVAWPMTLGSRALI
jgi:type VI secretion system protein ImpG